MIEGIQISADGDITEVALDSGYRALQAVVGGAVEAVASRSGNSTLWAHEEAKIIGLPVNPLGTYLLWLLNPAFRGHDFLAGTVLVTGGADADGHTLSVGPEALAALALLAERAEQRPA
jgi:hypothetical protein